MRRYLLIVVAVALLAGCSGNNENAHTTATTIVPPPPRQVLKAYSRPRDQSVRKLLHPVAGTYDRSKALLVLIQPNKKDFREGEEVVIDFWLENAKLKGDGGEYRVRYIVDDDEMQWIDWWEQVVLYGWLPGNHTIRVELVGPDGWPYPNGDHNIVTRGITVVK